MTAPARWARHAARFCKVFWYGPEETSVLAIDCSHLHSAFGAGCPHCPARRTS
jgi:hypothetical protein